MQEVTLQSLQKKLVIDFGHRSKVWLVKYQYNFYALKEVPKSGLTEIEVQHLFEEKEALSSLSHPRIIKLHTTFKDSNSIYFLLELAKGAPLSHVLKQQRRFPLVQVKSIACQIAKTLSYIHSEGFLYRDLKLSNILLDTSGRVKFVDFGLCKRLGTEKVYTVTGTKHAMSPEVFKHLLLGGEAQGYSYEVDWWALGIMTFELLTGSPPFGLFGDDIWSNVLRGIGSINMREIPSDAQSFIRGLLDEDPNQRLGHSGAEEVLEHPFIYRAEDSVLPNDNQIPIIENWCEFLDDSEPVPDQDPFADFS